jgi:serine/threonine-protein kinase HipA
MRKAEVFRNGQLAGTLTQYNPQSYEFVYTDEWLSNDNLPSISLTLPKTRQKFKADHLFPFFFNMLSEGVNRRLQCRQLKIDENDHFGLLVNTATNDTIGAVTVKLIASNEHA